MSVRFCLATLLTVGALGVALVAQETRPTEPADAVTALVTELRAIRADLALASERSLRFQLLLARLQLQEQRIGHLDRQRADVVKTMMEASTVSNLFASQFRDMQSGCADAPADERKACESRLAEMKAMLGTHEARDQQLRAQEQELAQAIAAEQGLWADFNARLDDLERVLSGRR